MTRPTTVRRLAVVATAVAAGAAPLLVAAPASAAPLDYVALGDSYSSGVGTRSYVDDGACRRSDVGYPALTAARVGATLDLQACSGAVVGDVLANQVAALDAGTDLVTITVGGNDAGFSDVVTECALPGWASDCDAAIDGAQAYVSSTLPGRLDAVYAEIGSRAPGAQVVVAGYPRLFQGEDCNAGTFFSPAEQERLNATADRLDAVTATEASAYGFDFVDVVPAFTGHAVCDDPAWINGLSNPVAESYHPNQAGHAAYADLVVPVVR